MNKYFKNTVLCSNLDYHCLLCGESFEDIPSVEKHIRWEKHRKSLKDHTCLPKFKKDLIHKIGEFHYCEICNSVLKQDGVSEHIKSDDHKARKSNSIVDNNNETVPLGSRDSNGSIKFPKLTINRLKWHSLDSNKCILCDATTVDNIMDHIASSKHMINLIQSKVIEETGHYYRKIDQSRYYCFNCAKILNEDSLQIHSCKKAKSSKKDAKKNNANPKKCESTEMLNLLADVEKKDYEINVENKTAKCRLCNAFLDVTFNALCKHREQYHEEIVTYIEPQDHGKNRAELASYGRDNFIKLNEGGSKGYCSLCNIYLSANMKVATGHVNGARHRGNLELKGLVALKRHSLPGRRVQPLQQYLEDLFYVKPLNAFCVNYALSVGGLSFMFITNVLNEKKERRKCYCCDVFFKWEELKEHWGTKKHRDAFIAADVLVMEDEFIRIIHPGLFHCGFCNDVFPFWETMQRHLETWSHKYAKKKHEVAFVFSVQWSTENETNGRIRISDQLYQQLLKLGMLE